MCDGVISSNEAIYVNSLTLKGFKGPFMVLKASYGDFQPMGGRGVPCFIIWVLFCSFIFTHPQCFDSSYMQDAVV